MHRRAFLGMTAAASMRVTGANNRVRAGLIGSGLRSQYLTGKFVEFGAEVAASVRYGKAIIVVPMTSLAPVLTIVLSLAMYQVIPNAVLVAGMVLACIA